MMLDLNWPPAGDWPARAAKAGVVRIRGVPTDTDNASLRALARALGQPSPRALAHRAGLVEPGCVQRIEACVQAPPDQYGKPLLSASHAAFELHSDESFHATPARWLLLHCWRPARQGGDSLLLDAQQWLHQSERVLQIALRQLYLPYPCGDLPCIDGQGRLRFNRAEILGAAHARAVALSSAQAHWLERFSRDSDARAQQLALERGDLLVIDNWRFLHGRTAFAADGGRLFKRLRVQ